MSALQILFSLYFAFVGAYLSVILAKILKQNGRVLDRMDEGFKLMERRMDEGFRLMGEKMDEGFRLMGEKMDEGFRRTGEKMDEGFKLIAKLIVEENGKTRKEILDALKSSSK